MRVTIIKADNTVYMGGIGLSVDCSSLPANFHALQWYDTWGVVETIDAEGNAAGNQQVADLSPYQSFVDSWNAAQAAATAAQAAKSGSAKPGTVNVVAAS
jgi:hypothetical protein